MKGREGLAQILASRRDGESVQEGLERLLAYCNERRRTCHSWAVADFAEKVARDLQELLEKARKR